MAPLSQEKENYIRLTLLLKGFSQRAVRTYFDREFPPTSLPLTLRKNYTTIYGLKFEGVLNQSQWNRLFPKNGVPSSKKFDVTLMIYLIKTLTSTRPINGFYSLPSHKETTPVSDLARVKWYRQKLLHHDSDRIDTAWFNSAWSDLSGAVSRLGGKAMYQECQELRVTVLEQSNRGTLLEIKTSMQEMKELRQTMDRSGTKKVKTEHSEQNVVMTEGLKDIKPWDIREMTSSSLSEVPGILQTNYARIAHAVKRLFPEILQELLTIKEPPQKLSHDVITNRYLSNNLRPDELLFINNTLTLGYTDFDIPLVYKLVRNLKLLPPPTKGWGHFTAPCVTEVTPGDDIERIRKLRSEILIKGNAHVTDTELPEFFTQFKDIAGRLERYLGKQNGEFVNKFIYLESCYINEKTNNLFMRFERKKKTDEDCERRLIALENDIDSMKEMRKHCEKRLYALEKNIEALKERSKDCDKRLYAIEKHIDALNERSKDCKEILYAIEKHIDVLKERMDNVMTNSFRAISTSVIDDVEINGYKGFHNKVDNVRTSSFRAISTSVKDDVEINGYKGFHNKEEFYKCNVVCDGVVVDCIIARKLERKCMNSIKEFQEFIEEMQQLSEKQPDFHEKVKDKFQNCVVNQKSCLCQYLLNTLLLKHTSNNAIGTHILVDALYTSIQNDDVETAKFIGWQIARNFLKSFNLDVYDIWLASVCSCSKLQKKHFSWFCSTNVSIVVIVPHNIKEIVNNFAGLPVKQILYHCEIFKEAQAISEERTKLSEKDLNFQSHVPGPLAEKLFNNHRRLTLVCPSEIKSINFPTVPMFLTRSCIQLHCYVKGAIPIGENHFPREIQGISTDVIEGFSRFSSNILRIGDSVTNRKKSGTLGGFCRFYGREAFLTCAHVLMDWETLLSTGQKHHTQLESVHLSTADKILNETPLCGKIVNHSFTHHNPQKISTDVAVIELDDDFSVSLDGYVNTRGNGSLHYKELGLKSRFLQDGYIQSPKELLGKNVKVVCAGAVLGFKDSVSLISEVSERDMEREDVQSASTNLENRILGNLNTLVHVGVHMIVRAIINESRKEEERSQRSLRFYNQLAVHNISFQQGDSGACVYITNGFTETGCLGMAVADFPGGGCVVTPMASLLEKLALV